jgi:hypothetical protein
MNMKLLKTTGLSFALATAFLVAAGAADSSTALAQGRQWRDRDHDGRIDTRREMFQEQRGFNDGFAEGRRDAFAHRRYSPFDSIRYRFSSFDYRQGFQRGYAQAYRQFAFNRDNRYGRRY